MGYEVRVDSTPIYELLGSFLVYATKKWVRNLDLGFEFIETADQLLDSSMKSEISQSAFWPFADYDTLYAWAINRPAHIMEAEQYIDYAASAPEAELLAAASPLLPNLQLEDVMRIRRAYLPLLKHWYIRYFANIEQSMRHLSEEDAAEKQLLLTKMAPEDLVEYATSGLVVRDLEGISSVVLFPTVHNRPINTYCFYKGVLFIQYPVELSEEDAEQPPVILSRLTFAVNDLDRLRLLRFLGKEPKSLDQMIEHMNLTEDVLTSHLMVLRTAGMLRIHLDLESHDKYNIRPEGLGDLQMFLESYIGL
ncbi:ArsR family transcriptional regulator [Paenibacillus sp. JX-17]|uniref:ArsR family transcriptional regulator n=1 Tax=Paenibacillus lacisoli TaxID=3064525 RepID=A0ABT9C6K9_9BACL|nr:ArsR family transcriptional regulator [Paenibacillus sp. JX-17]MDO7904895.1 ArsR family transcriptional regulator [Paenibacillus sp. JX-17]